MHFVELAFSVGRRLAAAYVTMHYLVIPAVYLFISLLQEMPIPMINGVPANEIPIPLRRPLKKMPGAADTMSRRGGGGGGGDGAQAAIPMINGVPVAEIPVALPHTARGP